jgi:transcriptional regulator with XRE-family HTH domain
MTGNDRSPRRSAEAGVFGAALRRHRRGQGLSQEDLADATGGGIAVRTISDLERGVARRPRAETVRLLAAALGLTGNELAEFRAAAYAASRLGAAAEVAAELTALAVSGLAEASRRVAARPLIIVADPARLPEVEPLLSLASDCLVVVTSGNPTPGQDELGGDTRVVPLAALDLGELRRGFPA